MNTIDNMINIKHVHAYCCEDPSLIENYDKAIADETQTWDCHHRLEIQGQFVNSPKLLKKCCMYYNVPASQLIFLKHGEHISLHNKNLSENTHRKLHASMINNTRFLGKHHSEDTRKRLSDSHSGNKNPFFGRKHSADTLKKLSLVHIGNANTLGMHWYNNGIENKLSKERPAGFVEGRLKRSK